MKNPLNVISREPVMAAILTVVGATVALLVAFHVHVTADQREAIEGWVGAVLLLGVAVRSQVTVAPKAAHVAAAKAIIAQAQAPAAPAASAPEPAPVLAVVGPPVDGPDHPA